MFCLQQLITTCLSLAMKPEKGVFKRCSQETPIGIKFFSPESNSGNNAGKTFQLLISVHICLIIAVKSNR